MSKKNKVVYSNIQPNTKEAGIWVNTDDGNIKIEKDGKWVDDGGNGGNAEASNIEYLDVSELNFSVVSALKGFGLELRMITDEGIIVSGTYCGSLFSGSEVAVSIDFNKEIIYNSRKITVLDVLIESSGGGINKEYFDSIPRITKEQFYAI